MPLPFILVGAAALAGLTGIAKGVEASSNNSRANELIADAEAIYEKAKGRLDHQKTSTTSQLDSLGEVKLKSWSEDIGGFIKLFSQYKNVKLESKVELDKLLRGKVADASSLKEMAVASLKASEVLKIGTSSLGAGALAGIASYGGAMMFASASTGTAISALSGVAATNATLAWFGGGSLAAGGFGMAGGAAVLGGIVVGPVLAVAGFLMAAKSEENLSKAKKAYAEAENAVEKMDTITSFLISVEELASSYEAFINEFRGKYRGVLNQLDEMTRLLYNQQSKLIKNRIRKVFGIKYKIDFSLLTVEQQQFLHVTWLLTQVLNAVLAAPLLTKDGSIESNAEVVLISAKDSAVKLLYA